MDLGKSHITFKEVFIKGEPPDWIEEHTTETILQDKSIKCEVDESELISSFKDEMIKEDISEFKIKQEGLECEFKDEVLDWNNQEENEKKCLLYNPENSINQNFVDVNDVPTIDQKNVFETNSGQNYNLHDIEIYSEETFNENNIGSHSHISAHKRSRILDDVRLIRDLINEPINSDSDISMESESFDNSCSDDDTVLDSESNSESDDSDINSNSTDWAASGNERQPFVFTANSGVTFDVLNKDDPVEFFEQFFYNEIFEHITTETNRFARQFLDEKLQTLSHKSRMKKWFDCTVPEVKVFVALLILQGVDSKSHNSMYFSKRESVRNSLFPKVMSGRRFELLSKFLHFVDNTTIEPNMVGRKLAKIQPFIDMLLPKFMTNYIPKKCISVNESLLGWKGRLSWKQYIPTKRKRFGVKIFELCESASGYVWNFVVYTGAHTRYNEQYSNLPVKAKIVFTLCDPLLDKGYCLYTDNFYTSPILADALVQRQTDCIGTLKLNRREVPKRVKERKLKKGETVAAFRQKTMVLKWKDKKDVSVLSTIHDNSMVNVVSRYGKKSQKPKVITNYNDNMGGVDLSESLLCHYKTAKNRMKKFYMKIFRHFLDISILNAYITYKQSGGKISRVEFIISLAENMIIKYKPNIPTPSSSAGRPYTTIAKPSRLIERHFPDFCPPSEKRVHAVRRCGQCRKNNKTKSSSYWCPECEVALCVAPCFYLWHTRP